MIHTNRLPKLSLQIRITLLVCFIIILVLLITGVSFYKILFQSVEEAVVKNALEISRFLAKVPSVQQALTEGPLENDLQLLYEQYLQETDHYIFFVLVDQNGIRYTHPNNSLLGLGITGDDIHLALAGESYTSKAHGISGTTIRTFAPVYDPLTNEQIGVLSVGVYTENLLVYVKRYIGSIFYWLIIALTIGIMASILLAKKIKNILHGYEPDEIAKLFREKEAILESLSEGIIAIDKQYQITLANDAAIKILSLPDSLHGKKINEMFHSIDFEQLLKTTPQGENVELHINGTSILSNHLPIMEKKKMLGTIITFRDITKVRNLAEELTGVHQYIDALRAKTHEFMNKLQTLLGLIELKKYDDVKQYITSTTSRQQDLLHFFSRNIKEPKVAGLLLGKLQQAEELNIQVSFTPGSRIGKLPRLTSESITLILGNLLQNAIEAVQDQKNGEIILSLVDQPDKITLIIEDNGSGITINDQEMILKRGFSTKGSERGYGLQLVKHHTEHILGGQLSFYSSHEGTVFTVQISKKEVELGV